MDEKVIKFKPGKITLYDRNIDEKFGGSLVVEESEMPEPEHRSDFSETSFAQPNYGSDPIQIQHDENSEQIKSKSEVDIPQEPEESYPDYSEAPEESMETPNKEEYIPEEVPVVVPPKNLIKEYAELINFPLLFSFIFSQFKAIADKLFYSKPPKVGDNLSENSSYNSIDTADSSIETEEEQEVEDGNQDDDGPPFPDFPVYTSANSLQQIDSRQDASPVQFTRKEKDFFPNFIGEVKSVVFRIKNKSLSYFNLDFFKDLKLPSINFGLLSKLSLTLSIISFILLILYFASAHINFSSLANLSSPKPSPSNNIQIGFEKPVKQFEPTPDPAPKSREFRISIDKINLVSEITPNVDLSDEKVYKQKLHEDGVAHALGSYFPGQDGPIYLFAHSTDTLANIPLFNAKFFALKDLEPGDQIEISYQGTIYKYAISDKKIIKPDEISVIQNTTAKLVLQTCWPPGTDWQRLIIFANPI